MKLATVGAVLAVILGPALFAARKPDVVNCAPVLQSNDICEPTDRVVVIPMAGGDVVLAEFADARGYKAQIVCAAQRQTNGRILVAAGVAQGDCATPNTAVANPQTKIEFAAARIQADIRDQVLRHRQEAARRAATFDPTDPSEGP